MRKKNNHLKLGFQLIILIAIVIAIFKFKQSVENSAPKIQKAVDAIESSNNQKVKHN